MTTALKITKTFAKFSLTFDESENLLYVKVNPDVVFDLKESIEMMQLVEDFVGNRKHKAIVEMGEFNSSSDEARKLYAESSYINQYRVADAFIVKSLSVRLIINFFISFNKPKVPTKAFNDVTKATEWLNKVYSTY